jgi:hypothetical protein
MDYTNGTPSLLLEPQRTNLALYSEQLNNAGWNKEAGNSITANSLTSPDGYLNADTITATNGNVLNVNQSLPTPATTTAYTFSAFLKKKSTNNIEIYLFQVGSGFVAKAVIDFNAETITPTIGTASLINYGNGWYRASVTATLTASAITTIGIFTTSSTGVRDVYAYGLQAEIGGYATSYIPTLGASVTRGADVSSKTGISNLIGQTEGVFFIDLIASSYNSDGTPFSLLGMLGNDSQNVQLYTNNALLSYNITASGVVDASTGVTLVNGQRYKIALAYKSGDCVVYVNGTQTNTSIKSVMPIMSALYINQFSDASFKAQNSYNKTILYPTRLTNSQLATLTTI